MSREVRGNFKKGEEAGRDHLFLWTVGILLLVGATLAIWLGSFYFFGHPEKPQSYALLRKFNKIQPTKRFELTHAPEGEFLSPKAAFDRYGTLSAHELRLLNMELQRDYIRNYANTRRRVAYITGRYTILNAYPLKSSDYFGEGVVAVAQAVELPQVVIEHIYTAPEATIPVLQQMLEPGLNIQLERRTDLAAIINVARTPDGRLQLTVVPLLYGSYALQQGRGSFTLEPPPILNPAGGLPIVRDEFFTEAVRQSTARSEKQGDRSGQGGNIPAARPVDETTIVRIATPTPSPTPEQPTTEPTGETHLAEATPPAIVDEEAGGEVAAATPEAEEPTLPGGKRPSTAEATPSPAVATPTPRVVAARTPPPPGSTPAAATDGGGNVLQPFLAASPTPNAARPTGGSWRTYAPGRMPRGRLLGLGELDEFVDRGLGGERIYLQGNFVVTATGDNRAVLRSGNRIGNVIGSVTLQPKVRVIVEFPSGSLLPAERSRLSRDGMRPFEVRDVQRDRDGQINVFVREVTQP